VFAVIGFVTGISSLTTIMIPALSMVMALAAIIFSVLGKGASGRGMFLAGIGMGILALILSLTYLIIVMPGRVVA